jgi:hypothetical protein
MVRLEKFNDVLKALISILIASLKPSKIMQSTQICFRRVEQQLILSKDSGARERTSRSLKSADFEESSVGSERFFK